MTMKYVEEPLLQLVAEAFLTDFWGETTQKRTFYNVLIIRGL